MASAASKTRPPVSTPSHRAVGSSASKTNPKIPNFNGVKASSSMMASSVNNQASGATVKKIKLTQKNTMPNGASHVMPNSIARKIGSTASNAKSHLNNTTTAASSLGKMSSPIGKNIFTDEEPFFKTGAKRPKLGEYKFAETSAEILQKYKDHSPSIEFHIHPTHYRFGNQDAIIPKNSPLIKNFLELVELELIPPAAVDVFSEAGVRYYEGCIILQIYDHRDSADTTGLMLTESSQPDFTKPAQSPAKPGTPIIKSPAGFLANTKKPTAKQAAAAAEAKKVATAATASKPLTASMSQSPSMLSSHSSLEPRTYRVLLRPSPLTLWYDLSRYSDTIGGLFSDPLSLALESEILATTMPRLDLSVPDDCPFTPHVPLTLQPTPPSVAVPDQYGSLHAPNPPTNAKRKRPLHEDLPHQGTEYEEMMLIMDERPPPGTGQFVRLGFVEQWRRKRDRDRIQRNNAAATNAARR